MFVLFIVWWLLFGLSAGCWVLLAWMFGDFGGFDVVCGLGVGCLCVWFILCLRVFGFSCGILGSFGVFRVMWFVVVSGLLVFLLFVLSFWV